MLVIKDSQIESFRQIEREKFIVKSLYFLKKNFSEWCADKDESEKREFIDSAIDFGGKHSILKEINVQKLMMILINYADIDIDKELSKDKHIGLRNLKDENLKPSAIHKLLIRYKKNKNA